MNRQTSTHVFSGFGATFTPEVEEILIAHLPDSAIQRALISWPLEGAAGASRQAFFEIQLLQLDANKDLVEVASSGQISGALSAQETRVFERITGFPNYLGPIYARVVRVIPSGGTANWAGIGDMVLTMHLDEGQARNNGPTFNAQSAQL